MATDPPVTPSKRPDGKKCVTVTLQGVTVRIYGPLPDRKSEVYLLVNYVGSRREKRTHKGDLDGAKKAAKDICRQVAGGDIIDALHLTPLDRRIYITAKQSAQAVGRNVDAICRDASEAQRILGDAVTVSHRELAEFWKVHHTTATSSATVMQVVEELLLHMEAKKRQTVTVAAIKSMLEPFGRAFKVSISHVRTEEIEAWLGRLPALSSRTIKNYVTSIKRLFNFAKIKHLPKNYPTAADALEMPSDDLDSEIEIYRPWELNRIIRAAPEKLVPCIALGAFAGLRQIEITRMEWSAIHWDPSPGYPHGHIEVKKSVGKRHRGVARRLPPIQPNLAEWLKPYRLKEGRISPYTQDKDLTKAISNVRHGINILELQLHKKHRDRPLVKIGPRKNGLRHSYGSYRLPVIESAALLALEMGNSEKQIFDRYRELVHPREVPIWWQITPSGEAEIIPFESGQIESASA